MRLAVLSTALLVAGGTAGAAEIFFEDFDEAPPAQQNFALFDQFTASNGTVDAYTNSGFGLPCPTLGCVDLDGSSSDAGIFSSVQILFGAGIEYTLSFNIAGNQRSAAADVVAYGIAGLVDESLTLERLDPFTVITETFTPGSDMTASVFFANAGGDNFGALLDFVRIEGRPVDPGDPEVVPLPAALPLLAGGMALLAGLRRRGRKA